METSNLARLFHRSYGGEDVATRPGVEDEAFWPKGPMLPGVRELVADAEKSAATASGLAIYFLLGGAGNGKSFAARELGSKIGLQPDDGKIAQRIYSAVIGGVEFALLNDATIAPGKVYGEYQGAALAHDIRNWIEAAKDHPVIAFCCVNRGIVIDEIRAINDLNDHASGLRVSLPILKWLADPLDQSINLLEREKKLSRVISDHVDQATIQIEAVELNLLAASVDRVSLIRSPWAETPPAKLLLTEVLSRCQAEASARDPLCPIRANVEQLQRGGGLETWSTLVESAEMASGRNLSYRDLWGLIALSIVGPRVKKVSETISHLDSVDELLARVHKGKAPSDRLGSLLYLTQFRINSSLFRAPVPVASPLADPIYPVSNPYEQGFAMVDPAPWGTKDSHAVESAMAGIAIGELPSEGLAELLGENWSAFDKQVERDLVAYCQDPSCSDVTRRRLISWFGGYMARAVALSTGNLGNEDVLSAWKNLLLATKNGPAPVPALLDGAFRALLFPQQAELGHKLVVPALAPRASPIRSTKVDRDPMLVNLIAQSSVAINARRDGGRLVLECSLNGGTATLGRLVVDFPLIRDALTWRDGREGQTESTAFIEPRLERCRASTVNSLPASQKKLAALVNGVASEVY